MTSIKVELSKDDVRGDPESLFGFVPSFIQPTGAGDEICMVKINHLDTRGLVSEEIVGRS